MRILQFSSLRSSFTTPGVISLSAIVISYIVIFSQQASQPYTIDEAAFPYGAKGILESGAPYFYNGETRPRDLAMWHPPLYVYTLALNMLLFGESYFAVRVYGAVSVLISTYLILVTVKTIEPRASQRMLVSAAGLFLLNPLVVSGSLIPDIDGTLGMIGVAITLLLACKILLETSPRGLVPSTALVWTFLLYSKFVLAAILLPVILVAAIASTLEKRKRIFDAVVGLLAGSLFFSITYPIFARVSGFPFETPFTYFRARFSQSNSSQSAWDSIYGNFVNGGALYLLTPGLIITTGFAVVFVMIPKQYGKRQRACVFLVITAIYLSASYSYLTGSPFTFPKYWGVVAVPLSVLVSLMLWDEDPELPKRGDQKLTYAFVIAVVARCIVLAAIGIWGFSTISKSVTTANRDVQSLVTLFVVTALIMFVFELLLSYLSRVRQYQSTRLMRRIAVCLVYGTVFSAAIMNLSHRSAEGSTRYYLSEIGLADVISYMNINSPPDSILIAAKDIGLQSKRRFYEDAFLLNFDEQDLREVIETSNARFLITRNKWDYSEAAYPSSFAVLKDYFLPVKNQPSVDFVIWEREK